MTKNRRRNQRGNTLVESALVLTTFLLTLIGIVDLAQVLYVNQALTERVRGVARAAAISMATPYEIKNLIVYGGPPPVSDANQSQPGSSPQSQIDPANAPKGYMGLQPRHVNVQVLDRTFNEHRLVVEISGLPVTLVSPLMAGRGRNLPLRITVPLEEP
jgi:hypothetical protein